VQRSERVSRALEAGAAVLGLVALVGCWWAEQHGQDQVSVAFGLIGGTLLAAAGYAWTGRQ
jgi:hypothetical protein